MTFDISKLKSISNNTLNVIAAKENARTSYVDDRFWTPTRDAAGNARAIIRILPSIRAGELPWAEQWSYAIHGPNGWYIETSRRTINQPDPCAEYIAEKWRNAHTEADKAALRSAGLTKARHTYIANILVVNDPDHPENNGQVKLWRFGQKIYDMITDKAKPDPFDETKGGVNVTDWDTGCNFKLLVYTKDNRFPTYEKSAFDAPSPIGDDATIVKIADKMYDLGEFTDPNKIKSYEVLKERVNRVFNVVITDEGFESAPRATVATAAGFGAATAAPAITETAQSTITPPPQVVPPVVAPVTPATTNAQSAPWEDDDINFDELLKDI